MVAAREPMWHGTLHEAKLAKHMYSSIKGGNDMFKDLKKVENYTSLISTYPWSMASLPSVLNSTLVAMLRRIEFPIKVNGYTVKPLYKQPPI